MTRFPFASVVPAVAMLALIGVTASCQQRCQEGPCCIDGVLAGPSTVCAKDSERACVGQCSPAISEREARHHCSGISTACDGDIEYGPWKDSFTCGAGISCLDVGTATHPIPGCECVESCCGPNSTCVDNSGWGRMNCTCTHQICGAGCCAAGEACVSQTCAPALRVQTMRKLGSGLDPVALATTEGAFYLAATFTAGAVAGDGAAARQLTGDPAEVVARYASDGTLEWTVIIASGDLTTLRVAPDGGVVVGGRLLGTTAYVGRGQPDQVTVRPGGLVAKLTSRGNIAWVRMIAGTGVPLIRDLSVASDGSLVASASHDTGDYLVDTGSGPLITISSGHDLVFRYDASGLLLWAHPVGSASRQITARAMAALADGSSATAGWVQGPATFGTGEPTETQITSPTGGVFVARWSPGGALLSAGLAIEDYYPGEPMAAPGGTFLVHGTSQGLGTGPLTRLDATGGIVWQDKSALEFDQLAFAPFGFITAGRAAEVYSNEWSAAPVVVGRAEDGRSLWTKVVATGAAPSYSRSRARPGWDGGVMFVYAFTDGEQMVEGEPGAVQPELYTESNPVRTPYLIRLSPLP